MGIRCNKTRCSVDGQVAGRRRLALPSLAPGGLLALVICLLWSPPAVRAQSSAPLDTLRSGAVEEKTDSRYAAPKIPISRKLLPDVQATNVPTARTPKQPPRIDDPLAGLWNYHQARLADRQGDDKASKQHLRDALTDDPDLATYQWWQLQKSVQGFDMVTLAQAAPRAWRTLVNSPLARGRLVLRLHQGLLAITVIFWSVLVLAIALGLWRQQAHDMAALFLRNPTHTPRWWLPLLFPLAIMALNPGWLGFLALLSVPLLIQSRGRVRVLLGATWVAVLALVFPAWPLLRDAVPAIDPASEVVLLEQACSLPPSGTITTQLKTRLAATKDPARQDRLRTALAIQEARRGNFVTSDKLFSAVLKHNPTSYPALVGKANNTYYHGKLDSAAGQYRQTARTHPTCGEVPYNLAQVYFKKLFIPEATESLATARGLGFNPPTDVAVTSTGLGYSPVVYPGLPGADMQAAMRFEAANYAPLITISSWDRLLAGPRVPHFALVGLPLGLAILLILIVSKQHDPRGCENCGIPLCRACSHVHDGAWLCPGCGETARRARSDMILATLLKNKSRAEGMQHSQRVVRLGRLLPGAGHLASERTGDGWLRLSLISLGFYLILWGWSFDLGALWQSPGLLLSQEMIHPVWLPLPSAQWTGWLGISFVAGWALLGSVWLVALVEGEKLRSGIPERFSLVPESKAHGRDPLHTTQTTAAGAHQPHARVV